jgi:hypothetical protein
VLDYTETAKKHYNRPVEIPKQQHEITAAVTVTVIIRRLTYGYRRIHLMT